MEKNFEYSGHIRDKKMKMIDFYSGFEGEPEIVICSSNIELRIWVGYFDPIMEILFDLELTCFNEAVGIAAQWCICTDWWEKTVIDHLDREISILQKVDLDKLNDEKYHYISDDWKSEIKEVFSKMLTLFENAKLHEEKVYIEEC